MPSIKFTRATGDVSSVVVESGTSIMEAARNNNFNEIIGECGGMTACATCHVYVDVEWLPLLGAPSQDEMDLIEGAIDPRANSRLSCQIKMNDLLDGIIINLPASQI